MAGTSAPANLDADAIDSAADSTVTEKRPGKPDQTMVLNNHDFMVMPPEEGGIENNGNSALELVEIELK